MSDQPTPEPDDPTVPDEQLPRADRDRIRDTARALSDGSLRMDSEQFAALSPRVQRRAWLRYQAAAEDREGVREKNARQRASEENHQADVRHAALRAEAERREEQERRRRPRTQSSATTSTADGMTAATFEEAVARRKDSPSG